MQTIINLAKALEKSTELELIRLDIQFNKVEEMFTGYATFEASSVNYQTQFEICEDGTISRIK